MTYLKIFLFFCSVWVVECYPYGAKKEYDFDLEENLLNGDTKNRIYNDYNDKDGNFYGELYDPEPRLTCQMFCQSEIKGCMHRYETVCSRGNLDKNTEKFCQRGFAHLCTCTRIC